MRAFMKSVRFGPVTGFVLALVACSADTPDVESTGDDDDREGGHGGTVAPETGGAQGGSAGALVMPATGEGGGGGEPDMPVADAGGMAEAGGMDNDAGVGGMGGTGGMNMTLPERLWVNRNLDFSQTQAGPNRERAITMSSTGITEMQTNPGWFDRPALYYFGEVHVRAVVDRVSGPTALETCIGHSMHGWDAPTCIWCLGTITQPGTYTCKAEMHKCQQREEVAGCYGASADLGPNARRTVKHLIWPAANMVTERLFDTVLRRGGASVPFRAKYQIVLVPKDQTFSGWEKYPPPQ